MAIIKNGKIHFLKHLVSTIKKSILKKVLKLNINNQIYMEDIILNMDYKFFREKLENTFQGNFIMTWIL